MQAEKEENDRRSVIDRCIVALHDYGTRDGATASGVMSQLKADGFTPSEIEEAIRQFAGDEE